MIAQVILPRALATASLSPAERIIWTAPHKNMTTKASEAAEKRRKIIFPRIILIPWAPVAPAGIFDNWGGGLIVPKGLFGELSSWAIFILDKIKAC